MKEIWQKIKENSIYIISAIVVTIVIIIIFYLFKIKKISPKETTQNLQNIKLPKPNLNNLKFKMGRFKPKKKNVLPDEIKEIKFFKLK